MPNFFSKIIFSAMLAVIFLFGFNLPSRAEVGYDLQAESLSVSPAMPELNTVVTVTAKVKNIGDEFNLSFPLKYAINFSNFTAEGVAAISPALGTVIKTNDYITFTQRGSFKKIGQANLSFSVDPAGFLTESVLDNNSATATVTVTGYDLEVEEIKIYPVSPMVNQACYILVTIKNNSSYNLYTNTGLDAVKSFPDFTVTSASSTMPSLNNVIYSGGRLFYGYEGKFLTNGVKLLSFTIDPEDALKQSDSVNNILTKQITVSLPSETDLAIDSVVMSQDKIIVGVSLDITVGIKNIGKTSLTNTTGFSKAEFIYNLPFFDYSINDPTAEGNPTLYAPLNPNDVFYYKFNGVFTKPGSFNLNFSFNDARQISESNYGNNSTTTAALVYNSLADAESFSIISKSVNLVSSTTAVINWQTDLNTTGIINYGLAVNSLNDNKINIIENVTEHKVTLNNLIPGASYNYMITAKNGAAEKVDMLNSFTMPESDNLRIVSGPAVSLNSKTAVFSWSTNLISSAWVYYKMSGTDNLSNTGSEVLTADHKIELKDLAVGRYDYFLSSTSTPKTSLKTAWASFEISESAVSTPAANQPAASAALVQSTALQANDLNLYNRLKGKIILRVQDKGQAYYVSLKDKKIYSLGKPDDAFPVIRSQGVGINNANLAKIPVGLSALSGADTDGDGLPDALETALRTDSNKSDSDGDGYKDKEELMSGNSPLAKSVKIIYDSKFASAQKGKIFLQVESRGEAWYVNPADGKRYFLARPADAFNIMRKLGAGVSNGDFDKLTGK